MSLQSHRQLVNSPSTFLTTEFDFGYEFDVGCSLFAKRPPRPFPSPFTLDPADPSSNSFSSYHLSRASRQHRITPGSLEIAATSLGAGGPPLKEGEHELLRGLTNGDDAVISSPFYLGVADGVGAWNTRPQGHAALWSRLLLHFWAISVENQWARRLRSPKPDSGKPHNIVSSLQEAYETVKELTPPWQGTTTACLALMTSQSTLAVLNLGDSQCFILRPREERFILKTAEQWHWFDCPRQLGTNSQDTPKEHAVVSEIEVEDGDIVIMTTDGLPDNLWEHEILSTSLQLLNGPGSGNKAQQKEKDLEDDSNDGNDDEVQLQQQHKPESHVHASGDNNATATADKSSAPLPQRNSGTMQLLADGLVSAAKAIATDPYAESPYMERGIDQGLAIAGGKLDDISIVVGRCLRRGSS